jgi:ABC-type nickel/cobalt efflux system permease component RcnA
LLVVGVGLAIVRWRVREWRRSKTAHEHQGHEHHGHDHDHDHDRRGLLGIGISAGILPCPTALVVLLAAVSLQRVGYGLVLIVAFSVGLAAAVTGIGLVAVTAKRFFARTSFEGPVVRALPAVSAAVVLLVGLAMTVRAIPQLT